jgi:hypothetical protein
LSKRFRQHDSHHVRPGPAENTSSLRWKHNSLIDARNVEAKACAYQVEVEMQEIRGAASISIRGRQANDAMPRV